MIFPHPINVVNKYHVKTGEYIGRGSPLGNPFSHIQGTKAAFVVDSRDEAVDRYEEWLSERMKAQDQEILKELYRLKEIALSGPLNLVCFCAPKRCHGDVIKRVIEKLILEN